MSVGRGWGWLLVAMIVGVAVARLGPQASGAASPVADAFDGHNA